jgi:hypothetical protein
MTRANVPKPGFGITLHTAIRSDLYRAIIYGLRHGDAFHGSGYHISDMGLPHRARGGHRSRWPFPVGYWNPVVKPISIDHTNRAECPARLIPATVQRECMYNGKLVLMPSLFERKGQIAFMGVPKAFFLL